MTLDTLDAARDAYERQAWAEAYAQFSAADGDMPLDLDDRERLAMAAFLTTHTAEGEEHLTRGYHDALERGDPARGARFAFWLGMRLLFNGEFARGGGWIARARELLDEHELDCAERGYVMVPEALRRMESGDADGAHPVFEEIYAIGVRFGDADLVTMGRLGRGQCLTRLGQTREGVALLDEAMVAVTAEEVSPIVAGIAYCTMIEACHELFDIGRAQEWTTALSRWCERQPDRAPFQGQCLVRRAELLQMRGAWPDAVDEVERARDRLAGDPALGLAWYVAADLNRLRGVYAEAEEGYRQAARWGYPPQPGLALLRLAQGQPETAARAIRGALEEAHGPLRRCRLLGASTEIMLATGDVDAARAAAAELGACAEAVGAPLLRAMAAYATGAVALAAGDPRGALDALLSAWSRWQELDAPYDAARTRMLIGLARRASGDEDAATMDLDAARVALAELGAASVVAEIDGLTGSAAPIAPGGLTPRELEVLGLMATGATNRGIATELVISEKTVARHVSNIFTKLDLSSRSAATAYAYEHGLL